jgi:hypothetical protein
MRLFRCSIDWLSRPSFQPAKQRQNRFESVCEAQESDIKRALKYSAPQHPSVEPVFFLAKVNYPVNHEGYCADPSGANEQ